MDINIETGGFFGILFIVFLILKLTHVIAWSWWLVTLPLWLPVGIVVFILAIMIVCCLIGG